MSEPTVDPTELAAQLKEESETRLIVASVNAGLKTSEHDDRLSTWALLVAGSIPALAWLNGDLIRDLADRRVGVVAISLLALSGIAGVLQRYWGHLLRINLAANAERQSSLLSLQKEQDDRLGVVLKNRAARRLAATGDLTDEDLLRDAAVLRSSRPDLERVDREVARNLTESQPSVARVLGGSRAAQRAWKKWGASWQLRYLTRLRAWQSLLLFLQMVALVAFFGCAGFALLSD